MFREKYKSDNELVKPKPELVSNLSERMKSYIKKKSNRYNIIFKYGTLAAVFVIAILAVNLITSPLKQTPIVDRNSDNNSIVHIPKIELPKKQNYLADMIGLIVYKGKIYTQSKSSISYEDAKLLVGEKLGTTKGNIDEWSKQEEYSVEFASTIGVQDVYTVKGYDSNFRIMTYGDDRAGFYECLNDIEVKKGEDIFSKLKILRNVVAAKWQSHDSWNYHKKEYKQLPVDEKLNNFISAMYNAEPYSSESLKDLDIYNNKQIDQKFIELQLKDGTVLEIRLFSNGYISYIGHVFFKVDKETFNNLWNSLK